MKKIISLLIGIVLSLNVISQCSGFMDFDFNPQYPTNSTYPPNTEVVFCCTMTGWDGNAQNSNWFEGFGLTLGSGWVNVSPLQAPNDVDEVSGTWLWMNTVTSESTGFIAGPGYFFEGPTGPTDGNPGNDWGDLCINGDCVWEFCITLTTSNVAGESLSIGVTPYADGTMGSWGNWECFDGPTIWDGTVGCTTYGCTNPTACNYDVNAGCDDGSCTQPGCTDPLACNYDLNAACDDGSCTYGGCIDPLACNFNPLAGCDDGSCSYFSMGDITHNLIPCPDTTCTGSEVMYSVTGNQTSIYDWDITGGGLVTTDQTNDCEIIWGNIPGTYTLSVQEITEAGCEGIIKTCEVEVVFPDITFNVDSYSMCLNSSVDLLAQPTGGEWSSEFMNGNTFIGTEPGTYTPSYTKNIYGCDITESINVEVRRKYDAPDIIYSSEFIDFCTDSYEQTYTADDTFATTYSWFIDEVRQPSSDNQIFIEWYDTTQTYIIKVIGYDEIGCESEPKLISVRTETCQRFFAPNMFTPNGDGVNDVFWITGLSVYTPTLKIFNRWGVEIYSSSNLWWTGDGGSGYFCENGVYNWVIEYKDKLGQNKQDSGHVNLVR